MSKFKIESTMKEAPERLVVYGTGGVGKSSLLAGGGYIFIAAEDGLKNIDAQAVKPYPERWQDILDAVDELAASAATGIAIDSLDWAEPLCWRHVCDAAKKADIEAFGYGKGYLAALDQWRVLLHKLSAAHARGKRIGLIAHGVRRTFRDPTRDDYDQWTLKLNDKATGLITEWADVVGFAEQETSTFETSKDSGRFKGLTTGKRVLRTNPHPAYLAKTRYALPKSIPLDYSSFARALAVGGPAAVERLQRELDAKLKEIGDPAIESGARGFLEARGVTVASLTEAIETANDYLAEKKAS